jgi:hypothetical protein
MVDEQIGMVYFVGRKWIPKLLRQRGRDIPRDVELEDMVQDVAARTYATAIGWCSKHPIPRTYEERGKIVGKLAFMKCRTVIRTKSTFGSALVGGYQDAYTQPAWRRESLAYCPTREGAIDQTADLQEVRDEWNTERQLPNKIGRNWVGDERQYMEEWIRQNEVPKRLAKTLLYAAVGLNQEDSAKLQGCNDRTIRNHLDKLRQWFTSTPERFNVLDVVGEALYECLLCSA